MNGEPVVLRGTTNDGEEVLVTLFPPEGVLDSPTREPLTGELAFREGDGAWARWGVPTTLTEEM